MPRAVDELIKLTAAPTVEPPVVPHMVDASANPNAFFSSATRNTLINSIMILGVSILSFMPLFINRESLGRELSETESYCLMAACVLFSWGTYGMLICRDNDDIEQHNSPMRP